MSEKNVIVSDSAQDILESAGLDVDQVVDELGLGDGDRLTVAAARKHVEGVKAEAPPVVEEEPEPGPPPVDPEVLAAVEIEWDCPDVPERLAEGIAAELARHDITEATVIAWHRSGPTAVEFLARGHKPMVGPLTAPDVPPQAPAAGILKPKE